MTLEAAAGRKIGQRHARPEFCSGIVVHEKRGENRDAVLSARAGDHQPRAGRLRPGVHAKVRGPDRQTRSAAGPLTPAARLSSPMARARSTSPTMITRPHRALKNRDGAYPTPRVGPRPDHPPLFEDWLAAGSSHRVPYRHPFGRCRRGGRQRSDGRWRQHRRPPGGHRQARRDLSVGGRISPSEGSARSGGQRSRPNPAQEHRRANSSIFARRQPARRGGVRKICPAAPFIGGLAIRQYRRRSGSRSISPMGSRRASRPTSHGYDAPS